MKTLIQNFNSFLAGAAAKSASGVRARDRTRGLCFAGLLALGAATGVGATPSAYQDPAQDLEDATAEAVAALFERRPWLAIERGYDARNLGAGRYGFAARSWWIEVNRDLDNRIDVIDRTKLGAGGNAYFDVLLSWAKAERIDYESRSPERRNAASFVERIERILHAHMSTSRPAAVIQSEVLHLLAQLPEYWNTARLSLVAPIERWNVEAIERTRALENQLNHHRTTLLEGLAAGEERAAAEATYGAALRTTKDFRTWLESSHGVAGDLDERIEGGRWESLVQKASGTPWTLADIRQHVLLDIARAERRYGATWRSTAAHADVAATDSGTMIDHSLDAMVIGREARVVAGQAAAASVRFAPSDAPPGAFGATSSVGSKGIETIHLALALPASVGVNGVAARALRYGPPGESLLRERLRAATNPLGRYLWNQATLSGFGLYALDWLQRVPVDGNRFASDSEFAAAATYERIVEGARCLAALETHALGLSIEDVTDGLRHRANMELDRARREARHALSDPLFGVGYLGWAELRRLEEDARGDGSESDAIRRTVGVVLKNPGLRPADLRRLLDQG